MWCLPWCVRCYANLVSSTLRAMIAAPAQREFLKQQAEGRYTDAEIGRMRDDISMALKTVHFVSPLHFWDEMVSLVGSATHFIAAVGNLVLRQSHQFVIATMQGRCSSSRLFRPQTRSRLVVVAVPARAGGATVARTFTGPSLTISSCVVCRSNRVRARQVHARNRRGGQSGLRRGSSRRVQRGERRSAGAAGAARRRRLGASVARCGAVQGTPRALVWRVETRGSDHAFQQIRALTHLAVAASSDECARRALVVGWRRRRCGHATKKPRRFSPGQTR